MFTLRPRYLVILALLAFLLFSGFLPAFTEARESPPLAIPRSQAVNGGVTSGFAAQAFAMTAPLTTTVPITPTITVTATLTVTPTITITPTETLTPTVIPTETTTPEPSTTPTPEPTLTPTPPLIYLPMVSQNQAVTPTPELPEEVAYFCTGQSQAVNIPDNDPNGVTSLLQIRDARTIHDLNVRLEADHTYVSDLYFELTHLDTGTTVPLLDRPGIPNTQRGCEYDDIGAIFDDEMTLPGEDQCSAAGPAAIAGGFLPASPLAAFDGESIAGTWQLRAVDLSPYDAGTLRNWCLAATIGGEYRPTPLPPPPDLPDHARIWNISGQKQRMPLDCETRVAVDWARFFGVSIDEFAFFENLPVSDNPDAGFVGDVWGVWGQIPPYSYGVHAEPIAALLRQYGLPAYAHRPLRWDDLRAEIAAGRPVYVWTIGAAQYDEIPIYYTAASDGHTTIVAHYEHTIMVIGYTPDDVIIMDGGTISTRPKKTFLSSWSALGNMAITSQP